MFIRCTLLLFVVLTISWLARVSSYTDSSNNLLLDELTKSCPSDDIPVCGVQQKMFFLFSSDCLFEEINKDVLLGETNFKKVPLKYCLNGCQFSCAKTYKPTCARSKRFNRKKMFVNLCELTKYVCQTNTDYKKLSLSECQRPNKPRKMNKLLEKRSQSQKQRPIPCKNVFKPVCGSYMGVKSSFKNECLLNAENVKFNRDWRVVKQGMCDEDYSNARQPTEKPSKPHSIKKRSLPENFDMTYPAEHEYNTNEYVDYNKDHTNVSPKELFVYMPPAFQTQFLNHDTLGYQHPIPVHKMISMPPTDLPILAVNGEEVIQKLEEPIYDESFMKPMPFSPNYNPNLNFGHNINGQSLSLAVNTFMDEENKNDYYEYEKIDSNNKKEEIPLFSTITETSTGIIPTSEKIPATTSKSKTVNTFKQFKRLKISEKTEKCNFGTTPICGSLVNGTVQTFSTICDMMTANIALKKNTWTKLHEGECEFCKYNCSRDYQPICVTRNGVNYTMINDCYYNMGICMDKKSKWQKLGNGECERYTRIPDKLSNSKLGFPYTRNYFIAETTPSPSNELSTISETNKHLDFNYRTNKRRKSNPKRAVSRRSSYCRCCSRSHYRNKIDRDSTKCKCCRATTQKPLSSKISLYGPQTESYIMRLVKD